MALRRKILLGLLILPAATIIAAMVSPGSGGELAFLIIGVPVLVLNAWEFFLREGESPVFELSRKRANQPNPEGSVMKTKSIAALIIISSVFVLLIIGYTAARSVVDQVPYFYALYIFLIKLGSKLWHFLSTPLIFIALLVFVLVLAVVPQIIQGLRKTRETETAAFADIFRKPVQSPLAEVVSQSEDNESILAMERMIGEGIDLKAVQLMLEIDGIELTKPYLLGKVEALGIDAEVLPVQADRAQKEAFYRGVLEGLYGYLFPLFCGIETKNEEKTARFTLKPGLRDKLMLRLNQGSLPPEAAEKET